MQRNQSESLRLLDELERQLTPEQNEIDNPFMQETIIDRLYEAILDPEYTPLDLSYARLNDLSQESLQLIQQIVIHSQIRSINLADCQIPSLSDDQFLIVCNILSNPIIRVIDLSNNDLHALEHNQFELLRQAILNNYSLLSITGMPKAYKKEMVKHVEVNNLLANICHIAEELLQKNRELTLNNLEELDKLILDLEESLDDFTYARDELLDTNRQGSQYYLHAMDALETRINGLLPSLYCASFETTLMDNLPNSSDPHQSEPPTKQAVRHAFICGLLKCLTLNDRLATFNQHPDSQHTFDKFLISAASDDSSAAFYDVMPADQLERTRMIKYVIIKHFLPDLLTSSSPRGLFQPSPSPSGRFANIDNTWEIFKESVKLDDNLKALIKAIDHLAIEHRQKRQRDDEEEPSPAKKQRK